MRNLYIVLVQFGLNKFVLNNSFQPKYRLQIEKEYENTGLKKRKLPSREEL